MRTIRSIVLIVVLVVVVRLMGFALGWFVVGPYLFENLFKGWLDASFHWAAETFEHRWYGLYLAAVASAAALYLVFYRTFRELAVNLWEMPKDWRWKLPPPGRCVVVMFGLMFGSHLLLLSLYLVPIGDGLLLFDTFSMDVRSSQLAAWAKSIGQAMIISHEVIFWSGAAIMPLTVISGMLLMWLTIQGAVKRRGYQF